MSRAYAEAARRGLVSGEVGRGTFVRGAADAPAEDGGEVCDLSQNHPPEPVGRPQRAALVDALASLTSGGDVGRLLDYPAAGGSAQDREAGASWIARAGLRRLARRGAGLHRQRSTGSRSCSRRCSSRATCC